MTEWVKWHAALSRALAGAFVGEMIAVAQESLDPGAGGVRRRALRLHQHQLSRHASAYAETADLWRKIEREEEGR
jgi:hypothetical protein